MDGSVNVRPRGEFQVRRAEAGSVGEWLPLLIVVVAVAVWWAIGKPPAVFVVRVRDGQPTAVRGKVTGAFLTAVADVFRVFKLSAGEVRGVARGRGIALRFSSGVTPGACQRLRLGAGLELPSSRIP